MELAIDYILAPDADAVEQRFTFRSPRPRRAAVGVPLVISMQTSRMPAFEPVGGFAVDSAEPTEWIGFVDDDATSYAYRTDSPLDFFLEQAGTLLLQPDTYMIEACGLTERGMGQVYVGAVGLDGLRAAMAREDSEAQREITGMVREADGSAAVGVRVHAELADGTYYTRTSSAADGTFALRVPEDAAVSLHGFRQGQPMAGPISVAAASSTADLMMGPVGMVDVTVTDLVSGDPLPSRIQILASPAIARPPGAFGETPIVSGRTHVVSPADGQASLLLAEGTGYTVVASRGYEYEVVSQTDVSIVAGESTAVAIALERVVDTPDVMCGDFHIHTTRSPDAVDSGRDKILSAAGEGLEIPVRTDHEYVAAFEPVITSLGLEEHIFGITSIELTTFSWGHFNVFPLTLLPEQRNAGAFDWANKLPPEVFADVRSRPESPAMIINHPRGFAIGAYFTAAQYDATTGMVGAPEMWDEEFRLVEVFNDKDFEANWDPTGESDSTVMDWFSFLNAGRRVFAVGSSDSHKLYSSPVGYPRTCIEVDTDSPATLRAMGSVLVRDRLNAGRATVSGGIYVDALGPGDDVSAATDRETVNVRVQAANWVTASRLRVFVDGALTETIVLDDSTRDPVVPTTRFSDDLEIEVAAGGSWVVFVADGDDDLAPVHPGRMPFGVTNPIFFTR
jgi:hypothetical protein